MHVCVCSAKVGTYDPDNAELEVKQAVDMQLPWDLRGPGDGRMVWKGQLLRKSGRYANPGGSAGLGLCYKLWHFAAKDPFFHPKSGGSL